MNLKLLREKVAQVSHLPDDTTVELMVWPEGPGMAMDDLSDMEVFNDNGQWRIALLSFDTRDPEEPEC